MANKQLKTIKFAGLDDTYTVLSMANKTLTITADEWFDENGVITWLDDTLDIDFSNGTLIVTPESSATDSYNEYIKCNVRCSSSRNGEIVFIADTQPTINLIVNVTSLM